MRLDWIFLPRENPCAKFYIIITIIILIIITIIIIIIILIMKSKEVQRYPCQIGQPS